MKAVVTGATGFIGTALSKELLKNGFTVYGIGRSPERFSELKSENFIPVELDFSDYGKIAEVIPEKGFDLCFHTAWTITGKNGFQNNYYDYDLQLYNARVTCELMEQMPRLEVRRVVFCGTCYETMYKNGFSNPINYYGIAKKYASDMCKAICLKNGIECSTALLSSVFGAGNHTKKMIYHFISEMLKNNDLRLTHGGQTIDWVYITDAVCGLIAAAESPCSYKDYYVGHTEITTLKEKLLLTKEILGSASKLLFGEHFDDTHTDYTKFDLNALGNDTGFECRTDFRESILKTAEWIRIMNW